MSWHDFFYFSKGERRALIVLLFFISGCWLTFMITDALSPPRQSAVLHPVCIYVPDTKNDILLSESTASLSVPLRKEESMPAVSVKSEGESRKSKTEKPSSAKIPFYEAPARTEKYPVGTIVELNSADTVILKKVPGIGSAFSNRIVRYRNLLGGFYSVSQLSEVYGIDEERYESLKDWFCVNPNLIRKKAVNHLPADSLSHHPYINYRQAKVIKQLCKQKGRVDGWDNLLLLEEFTHSDRERMVHYLSFE